MNKSLLVRRISTTLTNKTTNELTSLLMNNELSDLDCKNLISIKAYVDFEFYYLDVYFNPYKDF